MEFSRFFVFFCFFSWSFLVWGTYQLQSSQVQVLLQLRKHLEYPKELDFWHNTNMDLCFLPSQSVNISCQDNFVTEIRISGDKQKRGTTFNGFPVPYQTLSQNFSMDSLIATLSRLTRLRVLSLVSVGIWGPIPDKIHRLQELEYLDVSWNFLYGSVPQTISRIENLQIVKLDGNFLNGTLPDALGLLSNLTSLSLKKNRFSGQLPSSLQEMDTLTDINLSGNEISGKLPELRELSSLKWIDLSDNKLDSELPNLPKGLIAALLSNNSFSGRIPQQLSQLFQLQQLDLSFNALEGTPPAGLFSLPNITNLNLASNKLNGAFPMHLKCGNKLGLVDISNNRFTGSLPSCLSSAFKSRAIKYDGNCLSIALRHQHPEAYCVEDHEQKRKTGGQNVGILVGVICGTVIILLVLAFGFLVMCRRYCPSASSEQHLLHKSVQDNSVTGFTSELLTNARYISDSAKLGSQNNPSHRLFALDEVKAATRNFSKSTSFGEGSTGKMYKGRLENGAQVAIRCLTVSKKYTIRNLKLRLDLLARLRHPHLVCLLGHCIESGATDESSTSKVYLIYEFVPNGNYRAHLSETNPEKVLKWSERLAILIDIAKAVHFLHTGIIPGFFSNRLKANNILLNEYGIAKLSDYGLSVVSDEIDKHMAEEEGFKSWQMKSLVDDVYSFGLILLESLTGPATCAREEIFMLKEPASLGNPESQRRMIDPIVLSSCSQESLSVAISIMNKCLSPESSSRPSFEDVLWNLQYAAQVQATSDGEQRVGL